MASTTGASHETRELKPDVYFEGINELSSQLHDAELDLIAAASKFVSLERKAEEVLDEFRQEIEPVTADDFDILGPSVRGLLDTYNKVSSSDEPIGEVAKRHTS